MSIILYVIRLVSSALLFAILYALFCGLYLTEHNYLLLTYRSIIWCLIFLEMKVSLYLIRENPTLHSFGLHV